MKNFPKFSSSRTALGYGVEKANRIVRGYTQEEINEYLRKKDMVDSSLTSRKMTDEEREEYGIN